MSKREAWLTGLGIFAVAVVVRLLAATPVSFPRPEDTAYYVGVARNIAEGRGLVSDAIWSFGTPPLEFPRPAFEVWLPLPSILFAVPLALGGLGAPIALEDAFRTAQLVTVVVGSLVAVLAWRLAADVAEERGLAAGRRRSLAIGSGLTAAVYLPLVLHAVQPDSTLLFGLLALAACLLITRVLRDPRGARPFDWRLLALGGLLGLTALTRNEAVWLALIWAWLAFRRRGSDRGERLRLVAVVALTSMLVYAPWAWREWAVFGNPLPGQAAANALSVTGFDIFAWNDPPTLARYLAVGPARLAGMRIEGLAHNTFSVLVLLGIPLSVLGILALPWQGRDRALRPVVLLAGTTFLVTSLFFPVATTWGTFLHAAVPVHVLLIISALGALDGAIERLRRRMHWDRPVAWLSAVMAVGGSALLTIALLPAVGVQARDTARTYELLAQGMRSIGAPLDGRHPVIHDFPVWLAEYGRVPTLALPDESPGDVLDLARTFGAEWLVTAQTDHGRWPGILDSSDDPAAACFAEVDLPTPLDATDAALLADIRIFQITCPSTP